MGRSRTYLIQLKTDSFESLIFPFIKPQFVCIYRKITVQKRISMLPQKYCLFRELNCGRSYFTLY